jgi:hypothetical protein
MKLKRIGEGWFVSWAGVWDWVLATALGLSVI